MSKEAIAGNGISFLSCSNLFTSFREHRETFNYTFLPFHCDYLLFHISSLFSEVIWSFAFSQNTFFFIGVDRNSEAPSMLYLDQARVKRCIMFPGKTHSRIRSYSKPRVDNIKNRYSRMCVYFLVTQITLSYRLVFID